MATKVVATAIVKGVNRKLAASRAALTMVSSVQLHIQIRRKIQKFMVLKADPQWNDFQ